MSGVKAQSIDFDTELTQLKQQYPCHTSPFKREDVWKLELLILISKHLGLSLGHTDSNPKVWSVLTVEE